MKKLRNIWAHGMVEPMEYRLLGRMKGMWDFMADSEQEYVFV